MSTLGAPHLTPHQRKVLDAFLVAPGRKLTTDQLLTLKMAKYSSRMSELKELGYTFGKAHDPRQGWVHRLTGMPGRESQSTVEREPVEPFAPVPVMPVTPVEPDGPRLRESEQVGRLFDLPARERSGRDGTPAIYREAA